MIQYLSEILITRFVIWKFVLSYDANNYVLKALPGLLNSSQFGINRSSNNSEFSVATINSVHSH